MCWIMLLLKNASHGIVLAARNAFGSFVAGVLLDRFHSTSFERSLQLAIYVLDV